MSVGARVRFLLFQRDGFRCVYCGHGPAEGATLTVDHRLAQARDGGDDIENLVTACWSCNRGKSDLFLGHAEETPGFTGMRRRHELGLWCGSPPIGYVLAETGVLVIDERERFTDLGIAYTNADLVRTVGEMYSTGQWGTRPLAAWLNEQGYRTVAGGAFSGGSLRHMVENLAYIGLTTRHHRKDKQRKYREGPHEPVLTHEALWSDDLWAAVVGVRQRRSASRRSGRRDYPFRGRVVCGGCGVKMHGEPHGKRGEETRYGYACITQRERHACDQRFVPEELIAAAIGGEPGVAVVHGRSVERRVA